MTDSKRSGNSDLRSKLRGIKPAVIEKQFYASTEFIVRRANGGGVYDTRLMATLIL